MRSCEDAGRPESEQGGALGAPERSRTDALRMLEILQAAAPLDAPRHERRAGKEGGSYAAVGHRGGARADK